MGKQVSSFSVANQVSNEAKTFITGKGMLVDTLDGKKSILIDLALASGPLQFLLCYT